MRGKGISSALSVTRPPAHWRSNFFKTMFDHFEFFVRYKFLKTLSFGSFALTVVDNEVESPTDLLSYFQLDVLSLH